MTHRTAQSIGWVGSLNQVPLAEVLRKIALEERSGDLQVIFGRAIKTIYFDRGFVVFSASNLKRDRLGESMIEIGRISRHQFALASMLMKNSRRKFGQALVQAGLISEEELGRQVALQVNRILLSLFKVTDGIYSFDERPCIIPVELMVSLSIYRILLDGIRRMTDMNTIRAGLPSMRTRVRVSERPPFTVGFKRLNPVERDLIRAAGKGASIGALVRRLPHERELTLKACYGLCSAGLLEPMSAAEPAHPLKVQEETGSFVLSEIQQKFAQIRATNVRQEILMAFDRIDRIPGGALLKVDPAATPSDLQRAYAAQKREWEKKRRLVEDERSMVAKVNEIEARLARAYAQMLAERQRSKKPTPPPTRPAAASAGPPRERLAQPPAKAVPPRARASKAEARLLPRGASGPVATTPLVKPPEQQAPVALPPLNEELIEEIGIEIGREPAPERVASPSDTQPALAGQEAPAGPSATLPVSPAAPAMTDAQRRTRIQQLFRDVKLHFQVRDWEGAVSLLYELVRLAPDNASYHGMLARAMARHPVMRKDAERHFIDALRLAPQSADLHFSLGLYYKSFGMKSRADTEFRTVLRIQPHHQGARKHLLGDRRRKDPLRDMFRKIFG